MGENRHGLKWPMDGAVKSDLLQGIKAIADRFGIAERHVHVFLRLGLPARKINGRWFAHEANVSEFFRRLTGGGTPIEIDETILPETVENGEPILIRKK